MGVGRVTPARVTPELARELLAKAYPEPRFVDEWTAEEVDLRQVTVAAELVPLVAAAPALAELVANMRYEYAVQLQMSDGEWRFTDDEFYPFGTPEPRHVEWQTKTGAEELYASFVEDDGPKHIRIVRRLASEPEVAE